MKAKDTVMNESAIRDFIEARPWLIMAQDHLKILAEAQAEISFKLGREDGVQFCHKQFDANLPEIMELSKQEGIKEVVEWIKEKERMTESVGVSPNTKHITVYAIDDDEWQQFMESIGE